MNTDKQCKLCLEDKPLVKSHIIPKSFWDNNSGPIFLISSVVTKYPKRIPAGIYDRIVCLECEKVFGDWDAYGKEFLGRTPLPKKTLREGAQSADYIEADFDYPKLKLFFLSVLWRGHHSIHEFFGHIKLGPHEERLREMIVARDPGKPEDYPVVLYKFDNHDGGKMCPLEPKKMEGIRNYTLYIAGFAADIKVDQRPFPEPLGDFILSPDRPAIIVLLDFRESKEFELAKKIVQSRSNWGKVFPKDPGMLKNAEANG